MQWHSVGEFLEMGGYALYVWGSFGACALAMIVEPWLLRRQRQRIVASLQRQRLAENVAMQWTGVRAEVPR